MTDSNDAPLGVLSSGEGSWTLTFTRRLPHPQQKVWRAVTEPEHLKAWFPQDIVGERCAGARLSFRGTLTGEFEGEMLAFDPPSVMEFVWGTDRLRIELQADGDATILTLTDTIVELGKAARDSAGWHECLGRLVNELAGSPQPPFGEVWSRVHPRYVEALGPDAATIGPPAGWEEEAAAPRS